MKNLVLMLNLLLCFVCFGACSTGGSSSNVTHRPPDPNTTKISNDYSKDYVYIGKTGGNDFPDYTKLWDGFDDNLCWAATFCNVLESAGYILDNRQCVNSTQEYYGNVPGHILAGFNWYMTEYMQMNADEHRTWEDQPSLIPYHIADSIEDGHPVMLSLKNYDPKKLGHAVSVFGYKWSSESETFTFLVTDGDDSWHTRFVHVQWMGTHWKTVHSGMYNTLTLNYSIGVFPFVE